MKRWQPYLFLAGLLLFFLANVLWAAPRWFVFSCVMNVSVALFLLIDAATEVGRRMQQQELEKAAAAYLEQVREAQAQLDGLFPRQAEPSSPPDNQN